jgi:hypothetical protein
VAHARQGLRAIAAAGSGYSAPAREAASSIVKRIDGTRGVTALAPITYYAMMTGIAMTSSADELRAKRKARMRSISDEALTELEIYTALQYRKF